MNGIHRVKTKWLAAAVAAILSVPWGAAAAQPASPEKQGGSFQYRQLYAGIDYQNKTTCVIGPEDQSMDSVAASVGYAYLKTKLGMFSEPRISSPLNRDMAFVLNYFHVPEPPILKDAAGQQIILVDHASLDQAVANMKKARIVEVLDTHKAGGLVTEGPIFYRAVPAAATSSLVCLSFQENQVDIPSSIAGLLLAGIVSDTGNMTSGTVTPLDRQAYHVLLSQSGVSDIQSFYKKLEKAAYTHADMTDEQIFQSDLKEYVVKDWAYSIGQVDCLDSSEYQAVRQRMQSYLSKLPNKDRGVLHYLIIRNRGTGEAELLYAGTMAQEIAGKAFGFTDGHRVLLKAEADRSRLVEPAIRTELERVMQY